VAGSEAGVVGGVVGGVVVAGSVTGGGEGAVVSSGTEAVLVGATDSLDAGVSLPQPAIIHATATVTATALE
jgi:hypothetical protein